MLAFISWAVQNKSWQVMLQLYGTSVGVWRSVRSSDRHINGRTHGFGEGVREVHQVVAWIGYKKRFI